MTAPLPAQPWLPARLSRPFRSLRPYAFALGWLLLLELWLRLHQPPDERVLRAPLPAYGCMADDELERLAAARATGPSGALDVVLIGDSVLGSVNNRPGERLADFLGPALTERLGAGRPVRVFSLSAGGAHAADQYGALRRMVQRLASSPAGLRDLVVVVSSNPIFFSRRQSRPAMLYPCLLDGIDDTDGLRRTLGLPPPPSPAELQVARWVARHVYLYQQRRSLAETWLGGPPRQAVREGLHRRKSPRYDDRSWRAAGLRPEQYTAHYDLIPLDTPEALNYRATEALARYLAAQPGLRALVLVSPQNHDLVGRYTAAPGYQALAAAVRGLFVAVRVPFVSYDRDPGFTSELFLDNDHLTAAGNRLLAARLADALVDASRAAEPSIPVDNRQPAVR